jgi:hypothetical protein
MKTKRASVPANPMAVPGALRAAWNKAVTADEKQALLAESVLCANDHPHPAWPEIVTAFVSAGMHPSYWADMWIHDREALASSPRDVCFVIAMGNLGSYFVWTEVGNGCLHASNALTATIASGRENLYAWDGRALRRIDTAAFTRLMRGERE